MPTEDSEIPDLSYNTENSSNLSTTLPNPTINKSPAKPNKLNLKLDTTHSNSKSHISNKDGLGTINFEKNISLTTPDIITHPPSPPKVNSKTSSASLATIGTNRKKNIKLASSRNSFLHSNNPLYDEVSNKRNLLVSSNQSTPNVSPSSPSRSFSSDSNRKSTQSNKSSILSTEDNLEALTFSKLSNLNEALPKNGTSVVDSSPSVLATESNNFIEEEDESNTGMFDHFSFENMIANRNIPLESKDLLEKGRKNSTENGSDMRYFSDSRTPTGTTGKLEHSLSVLPPMLNPISKSSKNSSILNIPPVSTNSEIHKGHYSHSSVDSPVTLSSSSSRNPKYPSPINTAIKEDENTYKSVSPATSTSSKGKQGSFSSASNLSLSAGHRRSSSKGSLIDKNPTKSFFKFFGSKKYNIESQSKAKSNSTHSRSQSRSSDGNTFVSSSNNDFSKHHKKTRSIESSGNGNSPVSMISNKSIKFNLRSPRWDDSKRFSLLFHDSDTSSIHTTTSNNLNHSTSETMYSVETNTGSMPTLTNVKSRESSTTSNLKYLKNTKNDSTSRSGSIKSTHSSKSMNLVQSSSPLKLSNDNSTSLLKDDHSNNRTSSSSFSIATPTSTSTPLAVSNPTHLLSSSIATGLYTSPVVPSAEPPQTSASTQTLGSALVATTADNGSVSRTSTRRVKNIVSIGSKPNNSTMSSKKNALPKAFINSKEWNGWDGKSGSFEKIGPVGKKPNPSGVTIPVKTKSNLHASTTNTGFSKSSNNNLEHTSNSTKAPSAVSVNVAPQLKSKQSTSSIPSFIPQLQNDAFFVDRTSSRHSNSAKSPIYTGALSPYFAESSNSSKISINSKVNNGIFGINAKFMPSSSTAESSVSKKILVTSNLVDYKLMDFNTVNSISKFYSIIQTIFKFKNVDKIQLHLADIGLSKSKLGNKLDSLALQTIWDSLTISTMSHQIVFYITNNSDDRVYGSPHKLIVKQDVARDRLEEASLYTTSSANSDLSYDRYLPTPQHLMSVGKDTNIDYWNYKEVDRKPSITRASSITHSSTYGDATNPPVLSRKTSKLSITSGKSSATNASNEAKRISSLPQSNLVAKRNPPPPPPLSHMVSSSSSSPPLDKPPTPSFQRTRSKTNLNMTSQKKLNSNSTRSLKRSNTGFSFFSMHSSHSNIDPFSENQISFANLDSDESLSSKDNDDSKQNHGSDDETDVEFGLFAKKPRVKENDVVSNNAAKNFSKFSYSSEDDSSDNDSLDDDSYGLFKKIPSRDKPPKTIQKANNQQLKCDSENENEISSKRSLPSILKKQSLLTDYSSDDNSITKSMNGDSFDSSNHNSTASSLDIRPPTNFLYENLEVFFSNTDLDSVIVDDTIPEKGISRVKTIRAIAQEANKRTLFSLPEIRFAGPESSSVGLKSMENDKTFKRNNLLRRKSTKMWGQKTVEVTKRNQDVLKFKAKRNENGEFVEFAWIKGELIGRGKFGKVYVAMNITTGDLIAVKQMQIQNEETDSFRDEVDLLKDLDHINIVQYLGFEIRDNIYSIFLEYVPGGSIGHLLRKYGRFEEGLIKYLAQQILEGLNYIHSQGILHRDLKADNVLLEIDGMLKISDFGISKRAKDLYNSENKIEFQGTIFWMAPEIIKDRFGSTGYNAKVDIWALGCVLIEMFSGERPWSQYEEARLLYKLTEEQVIPPIKKEIRDEMSASSKKFLRRCLEIDASKRPSAQDLLKDDFCKVHPDFDFKNTSLSKKMHKVEEMEKENLNKRMKSMVRKL